jgi:hypothetical protein
VSRLLDFVVERSLTLLSTISELLETIIRLPSELGAEAFQSIWELGEVKHMGALFASWLARIRHRGAFMAIHPCYSRACSALLVCKDWPEVEKLPVEWLRVRTALLSTIPHSHFSRLDPPRLDRIAKNLYHSPFSRYSLLHPRHPHRSPSNRPAQLRRRLHPPVRDCRV